VQETEFTDSGLAFCQIFAVLGIHVADQDNDEKTFSMKNIISKL
jgi:hypothetical protein